MIVYILIYLRKKNHWYPKIGSADPFFLWKKEFFFHFQKVFLASQNFFCKNIFKKTFCKNEKKIPFSKEKMDQVDPTFRSIKKIIY